jgi:hypothetical protein
MIAARTAPTVMPMIVPVLMRSLDAMSCSVPVTVDVVAGSVEVDGDVVLRD